MLDLLILSLSIGAFSYVWVSYLTQDTFLVKLRSLNMPDWIKKPLLDCNVCNAGQMALWIGLVMMWRDYDPLYHFELVSLSMLGSIITNKLEQ